VIGRLKTVVLDAADMDAEAQFWSQVLDIPVVQRSHDWTTLEGRGVRLAVQLAPDQVRRSGRTRRGRSSCTSTSR
jgi:catechol-2,3-dioxygenase